MNTTIQAEMGNNFGQEQYGKRDKNKDIQDEFWADEGEDEDEDMEKEADQGDYQETINNYLKDIYYDPAHPASFTGITKLWQAVKSENQYDLKFGDVKEWLGRQETYVRHKPVKKVFKREKIVMSRMDQQWDADVMDMQKFARQNDGYRYLAIFIDIFSRYIWVRPLKTKKPIQMVDAMDNVFSKGRKPISMRTDRGSEYMGKEVQKYLKEKTVSHFTARNALHANYAERVIRTLKGKIYRYFTQFQTNRYIDVLPDIVSAYLNSVHSSTHFKPIEINNRNQQSIYEKIYLPMHIAQEQETNVKYEYDVGDHVHTLESRNPFTKGYEQSFTQEIFEITYRTPTSPPRYKIGDLKGENIAGTFYEAELQHALMPETFPVEKILRRRIRNNKKEVYVRWQGYPDKFNEWLPEEDIGSYVPEHLKSSKQP